MRDDILRLYNVVHVLVGTPGRILDLAEKGVAILKDCKIIIMDEADKVLFLFCVLFILIFIYLIIIIIKDARNKTLLVNRIF